MRLQQRNIEGVKSRKYAVIRAETQVWRSSILSSSHITESVGENPETDNGEGNVHTENGPESYETVCVADQFDVCCTILGFFAKYLDRKISGRHPFFGIPNLSSIIERISCNKALRRHLA